MWWKKTAFGLSFFLDTETPSRDDATVAFNGFLDFWDFCLVLVAANALGIGAASFAKLGPLTSDYGLWTSGFF